jgi:hypothetical protein
VDTQTGQYRGKTDLAYQRKYGWSGQPLDATIEPTESETIWAAGFYEGEGCVQNIKDKAKGLVVVIGQKDPEPLHWLRDRWGGSVRLRPNQGANKTGLWVWYASGDRGRRFLMAIYPWLWSRRRNKIREVFASESVTTERQALLIPDMKREFPQVKLQSALHGNMQKSAEMPDSTDKLQ